MPVDGAKYTFLSELSILTSDFLRFFFCMFLDSGRKVQYLETLSHPQRPDPLPNTEECYTV